MSSTGRITGTVTRDGEASPAKVVAIKIKSGEPIKILGEAVADAVTGAYQIDIPQYSGRAYLLATEEPSETWQADTYYSIGEIVQPVAGLNEPVPLAFIVETAGTSSSVEPAWPTAAGDSVVDGGATFKAIEYFRPLAHGPKRVTVVPGSSDDISENGQNYVFDQTLEVTLSGLDYYLDRYENDATSGDYIYRKTPTPDDLYEGGGTFAYARTLSGVAWFDEFELTTDSSQKLWRLLDGSLLNSLFPIELLSVSYTHLTLPTILRV